MPATRRLPRTLALAVLAALLAGAAAAQTTSFGPAPRGPDGRFANLDGPPRHAGVRVTFPFQLRRIGTSLIGREGAPARLPNDGAWLRENARHSVASVTWIGHATLLVQMEGLSFLTDPIWSATASPLRGIGPRRFVAPGLALEALPPIDFAVISHNHYDHLDLDTLEDLARRDPRTRFLVPLGNAALLRERGIARVEELDWGERRRVGRAEVVCLPAQHWSRRGLRDSGRALWASWAVIGPERRFYFSGDSGDFPGFAAMGESLGPFDLAALAIGAYEPRAMMLPFHLDPEQAVRAAGDLGARRALGVHFGTFDLSDEPLDEPPRRFLAAAGPAGLEAWILRIGETRPF